MKSIDSDLAFTLSSSSCFLTSFSATTGLGFGSGSGSGSGSDSGSGSGSASSLTTSTAHETYTEAVPSFISASYSAPLVLGLSSLKLTLNLILPSSFTLTDEDLPESSSSDTTENLLPLSFEFKSLAFTTPPGFNPDIVRICLDEISSPGSRPLAGDRTKGSILVPAPPTKSGLDEEFSGSGLEVRTGSGSSSFSTFSPFSVMMNFTSPTNLPFECFITTSLVNFPTFFGCPDIIPVLESISIPSTRFPEIA